MSSETLEHSNERVGATINSDTYLYGTSISRLKDEPYQKVLLTKLYLTKVLMKSLVLDDNMNDSKRIQAVNRAEAFNRELLKELGYSDKDISTQLGILQTTQDINQIFIGTKQIFIGTPTEPSLLDNFIESCKDIKENTLKINSRFSDLFKGLTK